MPRFRKGKRRSKRTKSVMPVRLWIAGSEDSHLAHTLDVSNHGVQLGGYRGEMEVGDEIVIQYRHSKHDSESLGSLLARAPRRSKSGLSAWSRESRFGVRSSLSKRMSTKTKNDRAADMLPSSSPAVPPFGTQEPFTKLWTEPKLELSSFRGRAVRTSVPMTH